MSENHKLIIKYRIRFLTVSKENVTIVYENTEIYDIRN